MDISEQIAESLFEFELPGEGQRLDVGIMDYLAENPQLVPVGYNSRTKISELIVQGQVSLDDEIVVKPSFKLKSSAQISLHIPETKPLILVPDSSIKLNIVYEDQDLLVINKQAGLVVHPGAGNYEGTLVNALLHYLGPVLLRLGDRLRPGIVHRLDKDTSGLMVVAKTEEAFQHLAKQFLPPRTISRRYLALTGSHPHLRKELSGKIEKEISRSLNDRKKMAVVKLGGKSAVTKWSIREALNYGYLLELELETGRTHQIRVHLQSENCAIVGDQVYSGWEQGMPNELFKKCRAFGRQALHAEHLSFIHPSSKERIEFATPPPDEMRKLIDSFRNS